MQRLPWKGSWHRRKAVTEGCIRKKPLRPRWRSATSPVRGGFTGKQCSPYISSIQGATLCLTNCVW